MPLQRLLAIDFFLYRVLFCLLAFVQPLGANAQTRPLSDEVAESDALCSEQQVEPMGPGRKLLDPQRPFLVDLGPDQFAVPWEYFLGRPSPYLPGCIRDNYPWLSIQYWIPDGKAPEEDHSIRWKLQPAEKGRPTPRADEWLIQANQLQYFEGSPPTRFDADRRFKNIVKLFDEQVVYDNTLHINVLNIRSSSYYYKKTNGYSLLIRCSRRVLDISWHGNRVCFSYLVLKNLNLFGRLAVPVDAIKYHMVIVETLETLIERWKVVNSTK